MERAAAEGRPFFAYVPTNAPHGPFHDVPEDWLEHYRQMDLSTVLPDPEHASDQVIDRLARGYAMISNIDDNVGRLMKRLDDLGLADNTIVVFLNDNGPDSDRYNTGLRGRKGSTLEGGTRSPLLVRWPGRLPAGGEPVDRIAAHIDIAPTLLDAAGVEPPTGLHLDGRSLLDLLAGDGEAADWPDRTLYFQFHRGDEPTPLQAFGAVGQRYKLVHPSPRGEGDWQGDLALELYDLEGHRPHPPELAACQR